MRTVIQAFIYKLSPACECSSLIGVLLDQSDVKTSHSTVHADNIHTDKRTCQVATSSKQNEPLRLKARLALAPLDRTCTNDATTNRKSLRKAHSVLEDRIVVFRVWNAPSDRKNFLRVLLMAGRISCRSECNCP